MTINHNFYLDLAYQLAERNLGKTGLNPSVGALVVKDNKVIAKEGRQGTKKMLSKLKKNSGRRL